MTDEFGDGYHGRGRYAPRGISDWDRVLYYGWQVTEAGCWEYLGDCSGQGYGKFFSKGKTKRVHRVSYEHHFGEIPDGMVVRHKVCDNPPCINPEHLLIGTKGDNNRDRVESGRHVSLRGSAHGMSKLNESKVAEIKQMLAARSLNQRQIAEIYAVDKTLISLIARGKIWGHVN